MKDNLATQAERLFQQGDYQQALPLLEKQVCEQPQSSHAHHCLGLSYAMLNQTKNAINALQRAHELQPQSDQILYQIGIMHEQDAQPALAKTSYQQCLALNPQHHDAWHNLSLLHFKEQTYSEFYYFLKKNRAHITKIFFEQYAIKLLHSANKKKILNKHINQIQAMNLPADISLLNILAEYYIEQSNFQMSKLLLDQAQLIKYDDPITLYYLGYSELRQGKFEAALEFLTASLENRKSVYTLTLMAQAQLYSGKIAQAEQTILTAIKLEQNIDTLTWAFYVTGFTLNWHKNNQYKQELIARLEQSSLNDTKIHIDPLIAMQLTTDLSLINHCINLPQISTSRKIVPINGETKIRLGFISSDFNEHNIGLIITGLLKNINKERFVTYGFYTQAKYDTQTQIIKSNLDYFYDIATLSNEDSAELIEKQEIDILIDLCSLTGIARPQIMLLYPAKVQMHYLGNLISMQHPAWQYHLSSKHYETAKDQQFYSEEIIELDRQLVAIDFSEIAFNALSKDVLGLTKDTFIYGFLNGLHRLTENDFKLFMEVLKASNNSILLFKRAPNEVQQRLRERAKYAGVDAKRLMFLDNDKITDSGILSVTDLCLTTRVLSGFTSTLMALDQKTPVIAQKGHNVLYKGASSVLLDCKLTELVAENENDFVHKAIRFQQDKSFRTNITDQLNQPLPIHNLKQYAADFEEAMQTIITKHNSQCYKVSDEH